MKRTAVLLAALIAASLTQAQMQPGARTTGKTVAATKSKDPKAKKGADKEEPEGKIAGVTIARPNGTFLGLEVVGGRFKLSFYDKKKKPAAIDVTRATARWPNTRGPGDYRTVLNPSGKALVGAQPVRPPFAWNVYLTLLLGEGNDAKVVENYVVPFHG